MMNKYILITVLIFLLSGLSAQEIVVNSVRDSHYVYVLIPFSQYIFAADSSSAYKLSINLNNSKNESIYHHIYDIRLKKGEIIDDAAQVFELPAIPNSDNYSLITLLSNPILGDRKETKFGILSTKNKTKFNHLLLAENDIFRFCPAKFSQIATALKSCQLLLDPSIECDSIVVYADLKDSIRIKSLAHKDANSFDLSGLLQYGSIVNLDVRYYQENVSEIHRVFLYKSLSRYHQQYSLKDQLQQIKYIASQNEWRVINKAAKNDIKSAIDTFWDWHLNSPLSKQNELRDVFYERVLKADELFSIHKNLPGWKSDRGRIFIIKGPPDDIIANSFPVGRYPYIEWHYYRNNRIYRFIDKTGYGNYTLMDDNYEE